MSDGETIRIAMWSGPRNLSTALMRAFGNRADCAVTDEPFYAAYLAATGLDHPMRAEVLAAQPNDWKPVAAAMAGPAPAGRPVWYQKHMTHHMLPAFGREFMASCRNAFLIRRPERVLASYSVKRETVTLEDIGFPQQEALFEAAAASAGSAPPVIDADTLLADPLRILAKLCAALGIAFDPAMLAWPAGARATDGVWAPHWYDAVNRSTGFASPRSAEPLCDDNLRRIEDAATPIYDRLAAFALT